MNIYIYICFFKGQTQNCGRIPTSKCKWLQILQRWMAGHPEPPNSHVGFEFCNAPLSLAPVLFRRTWTCAQSMLSRPCQHQLAGMNLQLSKTLTPCVIQLGSIGIHRKSPLGHSTFFCHRLLQIQLNSVDATTDFRTVSPELPLWEFEHLNTLFETTVLDSNDSNVQIHLQPYRQTQLPSSSGVSVQTSQGACSILRACYW